MPVSQGEQEIELSDWVQDSLCRHKSADIWYPPMDASNPNDYYAVGKLVCFNCPTWKECSKAGKNEVWGMWGGLTPQERKGTIKVNHGTREMYRLGCTCVSCSLAEIEIPKAVPLGKIPNMGVPFDPKSLLYDITST